MTMSSESQLCAFHYATRQAIIVRWRDGLITAIEPATPAPSSDLWIAPALFDVQVNGYGGVDFQQEHLKSGDLLSAVRQLHAAGCGRFLLTLITDNWSALTTRLRHLRSLRSQESTLQSAIAGWHVEGPFLSAEPGFHGAHNRALMCDPAPEHILELRTITDPDPLLLTLSPERPGALEAIALAVSLGIKVSLGHTDAPAEILNAAVRAGAVSFTHLGNGCPRELDRHDNILWRVFEIPGIKVSLIPDQIHVSPLLFRLIHRVLGADSIFYTTDAMSAAGMPPGRYKLGPLELEVGADQIVRQPGKPLFAGSALRPIEGVFRAAEMLGCQWQDVWPRFSVAPAKLIGLRNDLAVGEPADFCVLKVDDTQRLLDVKLYLKGESP
jgi:N-acetylglucosamine-6-phosphate deacetylase